MKRIGGDARGQMTERMEEKVNEREKKKGVKKKKKKKERKIKPDDRVQRASMTLCVCSTFHSVATTDSCSISHYDANGGTFCFVIRSRIYTIYVLNLFCDIFLRSFKILLIKS